MRVNPSSIRYHAPMDPHEELLQTPAPAAPERRWSLAPWLPVRSLRPQHRERMFTHLQALNAEDPYSKAGVFGKVTINETRWAIGEGKPA